MDGIVSTSQGAVNGAVAWESMFVSQVVFLQERELFTVTPGQNRGVRRRDAT